MIPQSRGTRCVMASTKANAHQMRTTHCFSMFAAIVCTRCSACAITQNSTVAEKHSQKTGHGVSTIRLQPFNSPPSLLHLPTPSPAPHLQHLTLQVLSPHTHKQHVDRQPLHTLRCSLVSPQRLSLYTHTAQVSTTQVTVYHMK